MNCREFRARHSEYVDGVIDASSAASMAEHARACASCGRYDRIVRRGGEVFRGLPPIGVSSDFEARMRHRLFHVRDELGQRRAGAASLVAAAASVVLIATAAAAVSFFVERTPVVEGQVVFAQAPRAFTPVEVRAFVADPLSAASDRAAVSALDAAAKGQDPHLARSPSWPVYSRDQAAAAFSAASAEVVVRPAEFRAARALNAGPILVRH